MLQQYMFKGTVVLQFTQKKLFSNKTKTFLKKFDYYEIVYAKDVKSAIEKRNSLIDKYTNINYDKPKNWFGYLETNVSVQGSMWFPDVRRVLNIKFICFENIEIFSLDISNWSLNKCMRNMTPQEYKEHCKD